MLHLDPSDIEYLFHLNPLKSKMAYRELVSSGIVSILKLIT